MNGARWKFLRFTPLVRLLNFLFNEETSEVGVAYTYKPDKFYIFKCDSIEGFKGKLRNTWNAGESVGKLISQLKKEGTLQTV